MLFVSHSLLTSYPTHKHGVICSMVFAIMIGHLLNDALEPLSISTFGNQPPLFKLLTTVRRACGRALDKKPGYILFPNMSDNTSLYMLGYSIIRGRHG